jgi:hypothetical protein
MVGALVANFGAVVTDVSALPSAIFAEDFNSIVQTNIGVQVDTGLSLGAWDVLAAWSAGGTNAVHDVDLDETSGKNIAVSFYNDNYIIMNTGFAANTAGRTYTVSFDSGPSVWQEPTQASNATDGLIVDVMREDGTILYSSTQIAGAWNGTTTAQNLTSRKFSYVGDGSGVVRLKISTIIRSATRFGGAIDNIRVEQSPTVCDPTSTTSGDNTILQFTTVGTCNWAAPSGITSVEALLVGGGGGGGGDLGGGGGGGQVVSTNVSVSGVTPIVVGAGGVFGWNRMYNNTSSGKTGGRSSIGSSTLALGGSGGNGRYSNNLNHDGSANSTGFTGGGGAYEDCDECRRANTGTGGAAFKGGDGSGYGSGGGGGAGGAGGARLNGAPGTAVGGIGVANSLSGASVTYGGGGGGGGYGSDGGIGGLGGGGKGTNGSDGDGDLGVSGTDGLGGGGGGAASDGSEWGHGGMGGSGVVIIKYGTPASVTTTAPVVTTTAPATTTTAPATTTTVKAVVTIDIQAPVTTVAQGQASVATIAPGAAPAAVSPLTTVVASNVVTSSTTTTTLAPVQQSSITLAPPVIPSVKTGESALDLGGVKAPVAITRENNQVVIKAGALSATLSGLGKNGATSPLDKDGNLQLEPGDVIRINVGGFKPGSDVDVWFFSTPTHLGSTTVGADGTVSGAFTVPAKIEDGPHRIAITAKLENGKQATFTLGVRVGAIPKTSTMTRILIAIPIMMAIAAGLILPNQIRRRRRTL